MRCYRVRGRVQGVGFRHFVASRASAFRLNGWVRNEPDGSVLVVVDGADEQLDRFRDLLAEGPRSAHVTGVIAEEVPAGSAPADRFEVRYL